MKQKNDKNYDERKIHRARVTEANLNYVGSITIDQDILEAVDILPNEKSRSSTIITVHV